MEREPRGSRFVAVVVALYTLTALLGAGLLFAVEPMVAKMLLPAYGGSPMVWNTAVLFFQGALLLGYGYAHWSQQWGSRRQQAVHLVLVVLPLVLLPVALPGWSVAPASAPTVLWLLLVLAVMVGAPFAVLATTGPLIQRWYSRSGLPRSDDPYFLYAASNVGSLAALLSYPFVVEPAASVGAQARWWAVGYGVFAVLMAGCAVTVKRLGPAARPRDIGARPDQISARRRIRWLALGFLPSSIMLGGTTHLSTDIAPVPLMWVLPLALYLLSFIVAFGSRRRRWLPGTVVAAAVSAVLAPWTLFLISADQVLVAVSVDLALIGLAGFACHGLLAADRPSPARLTEFFLAVSAGGALGGVFNGLLAPAVFDWLAEFPLAVACLGLLPLLTGRTGRLAVLAWRRRLRAVLLAVAPVAAVLLIAVSGEAWSIASAAAIALAWCATLTWLPRALALVTVASVVCLFAVETALAPVRERTFFGSYAVRTIGDKRVFSHGTTVHGFQFLDAARRMTPVAYYARRGPLGDVFAEYGHRPVDERIGIVGLGAGSVAAYGRLGQRMDFFEIDPAVVRIARDDRYFTFLRDCACRVRTVVGDGRLELAKVPDGSYGMIVLDAFSSDSIPAHTLTREAIRIYERKLRPGGVLAFNVSNRHLDLVPMLGATGRAAGLHTLAAADSVKSDPLSYPSTWVVMAGTGTDLGPLRSRGRWKPIQPGGPLWTDAYSSLFGVLRLGSLGNR